MTCLHTLLPLSFFALWILPVTIPHFQPKAQVGCRWERKKRYREVMSTSSLWWWWWLSEMLCALNSLYYFPHSRDFISRHTLHVVILVIPRRQFIWGFAKKMWPTKITFSSNWFCKGFLFEARLLFCYILSYFVVESFVCKLWIFESL